jgi:hypothetical protein
LSLIFEALKKLDREKQAPERGFLVVGASGWGASRRARMLPIAAALGAAGLAGFVFAQWAQRPRVEPVRTAPIPSAVPAASVAPSSVAPPTAPPSTYVAPYPPAVARGGPPPATAPRTAERRDPATASPPTPAVAAAAAAAAAPVEPTFTLQAVTEQNGQPVAIVNGQLVRVGDTVEGAQVLRIDAQAVELEKGGRRIVVSF